MRLLILPVLLVSFTQVASAANGVVCGGNLSCQANFLGKAGQSITAKSGADQFSDENLDEPSESNCAATVNISLDDFDRTMMRIYEDRSAHIVEIEAIQIDIEGAANYSYAKASEVEGNHVVHLVVPVIYQGQEVTDVSVSCK